MNFQTNPTHTADMGACVRDSLAKSPGSISVQHGENSWTRAALSDATAALARALNGANIAAGEPVVVEIPQSFDLVAGLCGVLSAGGVAVPLDPELSDERRAAILDDVAPRLSLRLGDNGVDVSIHDTNEHPTLAPELAFLAYTSGSSGRPKGVEISHASYVGRLMKVVEQHTADPDDVDLIWTPSSFIGMVDEVFFPLLLGIPTVIAPGQVRADPNAFADLVAREKITIFRMTPSLLNVFLTQQTADRLSCVKKIICSGEPMGVDVERKVHDLLPAQLLGFYGATEAPGVAYHPYDPDRPAHQTSRFSPQDFVSFRITDENGEDVDHGTPGEIWIGGLAIANGYWKRPELTAKKFVKTNGQRWYRTGDLGVSHLDGTFEILGRVDMGEVNVLGVRVNLSDVCHAMRSSNDICDAWISPVENAGRSDPMLIGHVILETDCAFDARDLRRHLTDRIPGAAIPTAFMVHDQFPLTANGKLDIQTLARHAEKFATSGVDGSADSDGLAPANLSPEAEAIRPAVLACVEDVLGVTDLTGHEDFFALGGNSLQAVELISKISTDIGKPLTTSAIFNAKSLHEIIEGLALGVDASIGSLRLVREGQSDAVPIYSINSTNCYARLAQALSGPSALYNLNIFGLTNAIGDTVDQITLSDLAQSLADEIHTHNPTGPWQVMAFCQDGCLAVEIGKILQSKFGGVCDLLMIDTFFLDHRTTLKMSLLRMVDFGPGYYLRKFANRFSKLSADNDTVKNVVSVQKSAAQIEKSEKDIRLYRKYMEFFSSYTPTAFDGPVTFFVSQEWRHVNLRSVRAMAGEKPRLKEFPGLHAEIFSDRHIHHLAAAIDKATA